MTEPSDLRAQLLASLERATPRQGHPRVFFGPHGLQRLRRAATAGGHPWQALYQRASSLVEHGGGSWAATTLALAHALWSERRFLDAAAGAATRSLQARIWTDGPPGPRRLDERASARACDLAVACDLLWEDLPGRTRAALLHVLEGRAVGIFASTCRERRERWVTRRSASQAMVHSQMGVAVMSVHEVLLDWRAGLRPALEGVLDFLDGPRRDGSLADGFAAWQGAVAEVAWFALALRNFTKGAVDVLRHPFFAAAADLAEHLALPDGTIDVDGTTVARDRWLSAMLGRRGGWDLDGSVLRSALCADVPVDRSPAGPPSSSRYFPDQNAVSIGGGSAGDAVRVIVRGGTAGDATAEAGAVSIARGRRRLLSSAGQSPLLVDGRGQELAGARAARLIGLRLGGAIEWALWDMVPVYAQLRRFIRYLIRVGPSAVVMVDDVSAESPRHLRWQLACAGEPSLTPSGFVVQGGSVAGWVSFPTLDRRHRYRLTDETWVTHQAGGLPSAEIRLVSVSPLHRVSRWVLPVVIEVPGAGAAERAVDGLHLHPRGLGFTALVPGEEPVVVEIALGRREVQVLARSDRLTPPAASADPPPFPATAR